MNPDRTLSWDWYPGRVPDNVDLHPEAYLETTYSFRCFHSRQPKAVSIGRAASIYLGVMFDLGPTGRVSIGEFSLLNGSRIIGNSNITIGSYCLISWNTVLMDTRRMPKNKEARRAALSAAAQAPQRRVEFSNDGYPITIGDGVWIGFDACVLPGVRIGHGAIVGARSVVINDVPDFAVVAGNPARVVRQLDPQQSRQAMAAAMASLTPSPAAS